MMDATGSQVGGKVASMGLYLIIPIAPCFHMYFTGVPIVRNVLMRKAYVLEYGSLSWPSHKCCDTKSRHCFMLRIAVASPSFITPLISSLVPMKYNPGRYFLFRISKVLRPLRIWHIHFSLSTMILSSSRGAASIDIGSIPGALANFFAGALFSSCIAWTSGICLICANVSLLCSRWARGSPAMVCLGRFFVWEERRSWSHMRSACAIWTMNTCMTEFDIHIASRASHYLKLFVVVCACVLVGLFGGVYGCGVQHRMLEIPSHPKDMWDHECIQFYAPSNTCSI